MALNPGSRLGQYEIAAPIGAGGMGEVYRATDTRLRRDVAIKVLPEEISQDKDRLARFEREAHVLASLNHPNIATIHGLEEADGRRCLVLELVEGETLADRLAAGAPPIEEALTMAQQVASALEAAHDKGIIHRDLKPANVMVTPEGTVKVLDFGLAKVFAEESGAEADASMSPTLTVAATQAGVILGTAGYMSPEQARGKPVGKPSDIWSFGVVLFELLTGERLFAGETVSDVLASVLKTDVDFGRLPGETPEGVRRLLRRTLQRTPRRRLRDIGDARIEIEAILAGEDGGLAGPVAQRPRGRGLRDMAPWLIAAAALAALVGTLLLRSPGGEAAGPGSYELSLAPPGGDQWLVGSNQGWGTISPDGRRVVVRASTSDGSGLWVRSLDREDGRLLPGTEAGFYPFWSPDSRWVAFLSRGLLQKVEIDGGLPQRVAVAPWGRGGSWSESGRILLTPVGGGAVHVVDAAGGEPRPVTHLDREAGESAHYWPVWLPDGKHFLYFIRSGRRENQGVYLGQVLDEGPDETRHRVIASSSSAILAPGEPPMLLWVEDGTLLARAFDTEGGKVFGPVTRLADGVRVMESQRGAMISASTSGTLVWASSRFGHYRMAWYDRRGGRLGLVESPATSLYQVHSSPDGRWVSFVVVEGGQGDVWMLESATGRVRALTSTAQYEEGVVWSPDSSEILMKGGSKDCGFYRLRADGSDAPRCVFGKTINGRVIGNMDAWLAGDWVVIDLREAEESVSDLYVVDLSDPEKAIELVGGAGDQFGAIVSPDGRLMSYRSDESGRMEWYVVSLSTGPGGVSAGPDRQRVPVEDLATMRFSPAGDELIGKSSDGDVFSIPIDRRAGNRLGSPVRLFGLASARSEFGIAADAGRFLFLVDPEAERQTLTVLLNWRSRVSREPGGPDGS